MVTGRDGVTQCTTTVRDRSRWTTYLVRVTKDWADLLCMQEGGTTEYDVEQQGDDGTLVVKNGPVRGRGKCPRAKM